MVACLVATSVDAQESSSPGQLAYQSCVACHGADGNGVKAGELQMAPSLRDSEFVKGNHPELLTGIILKGIQKEDNTYIQAMLALEEILDDEQIAAVVGYVTSEFGGKRQSVSAKQVTAWKKKKFSQQTVPWKRSDLKEQIVLAKAPKLLSDLKYSLYKGKWEELPNFSQLKPFKEGELPGGLISLKPANGLKEPFGMVFEGKLTLTKSQSYRLDLASDDGSALVIDGETILGNDGIHPVRSLYIVELLEAGVHDLKVLYFDVGQDRSLSLKINMGKGKQNVVWLSDNPKKSGKSRSKGYPPILLTPSQPKEAIVHRSFLPDANPRAIGVGYPGSVNLVWDADVLNLAYIDRGDFMDTAPHWNARGSKSKPLGKDRVTTASGFPFQALQSPDEPWKTESVGRIKYEKDSAEPKKTIKFNEKHPDYQFRGYRLDEKRFPAFFYDYQDLNVRDRFDPSEVDQVTSLVRTISIEGNPSEQVFFRIASTGSLEQDADWYDIGSKMKIRVEGVSPTVRQVGKGKELIAPITGHQTFKITYRWETPMPAKK